MFEPVLLSRCAPHRHSPAFGEFGESSDCITFFAVNVHSSIEWGVDALQPRCNIPHGDCWQFNPVIYIITHLRLCFLTYRTNARTYRSSNVCCRPPIPTLFTYHWSECRCLCSYSNMSQLNHFKTPAPAMNPLRSLPLAVFIQQPFYGASLGVYCTMLSCSVDWKHAGCRHKADNSQVLFWPSSVAHKN